MGCVQGKSSMYSPAQRLEKLKVDHGYVKPIMSQKQQEASDKNLNGVVTVNGGEAAVVGREGEGEKNNGGGKRILVKKIGSDEVVDGWPKWLVDNIPREALDGLVPKTADSYDKLAKVGQGTYSNVYKALDRDTGKIVALKKVRFDTSEPESVQFMAREIMMLQKLDHPNIIKLQGLATSRMQYSLYLVFDFMHSDLSRIISRPGVRLTEPQVKCYMQQLLSGLQHCHEQGILHRDIKGANLLIDKTGTLKIADFGLANCYIPKPKRPLTSRVVTLWYRAPELLLGSNDYGVGIDLWSAGCLLAEMFVGRPIMPGRTEVEQLHRIFKLCGSPSEDYWKKMKLTSTFRPPPYKPSFQEAFGVFPSSSFGLLTQLLALDPADRGCATSALQSEFFTSTPLACDLSSLPVIYKEEDEATQASVRKKHKTLKKKQGSRKKNEDHAKYKYTKEGMNSENSQDTGNGTSSASSSMKPNSPPKSPTPALLLSRRTMSFRTEGHPNVTKNTLNFPVESSKSDFTNHHENNISVYLRRSVSTLDFRTLDPDKISKLFGLEHY